MSSYSIKILNSVDKLVADAGNWNSLWERSGNILPLVRAEGIAQWMRRFASDAAFRAVMVESDGMAVAGIPLYLQRRAKVLRCVILPYNGWGACGNLLCDATRQDSEAIFSHLVKGLRQLPIDLLWCEGIRYEDFPWKTFRKYWKTTGCLTHTILQYHTAVIPLYGNPEAVAATWDKKEIANIQRRWRNRYTPKNHEFRTVNDDAEIADLLPDCFAIEHAGWKGREGGGSIIKEGMEDYFLTQAQMLAKQKLIRLYTLFVEGRLIAFQYGYVSGTTVFSIKIGYDPAMREFAPGMVLRWLVNRSLLESPGIEHLDCMGIVGNHQKILNPNLHAVAQVVFPLTLRGRIALSLYNRMKPCRNISTADP